MTDTASTYSHTGLTAGATRRYRVSAINYAGASTPSNTADATTVAVTTGTGSLEVTSGQKALFIDTLEGIASPATADPHQQFPPDKLPLCVHQRHSLAAPVTPWLGWMHR